MFELSHTLNRQFGSQGIYSGINLYSFLDNHDVSYISSKVKDPRQIKVLYALLMTLPGIPAIYYGSEWGQKGVRYTI
jgi:glycosidase